MSDIIIPKTLGIIGGGQLGLMLAEAANNLPEYIKKIIVLDPTKNCPATQTGARQIQAQYSDKEALTRLADESDIITFEIESGDAQILESLKDRTQVQPPPGTLAIIQDKLLQKQFLKKSNLPVPNFTKIESLNDLKEKIKQFNYPALLKTCRYGYDGRGNQKISDESQLHMAFEKFANTPTMLEEYVEFDLEVSIIAARNTKGQICTYPLVENIHKDNILRTTIAPARVADTIKEKAESIAQHTMNVLKGAGVFGIEMFVKGDKILINEIAPRVHNSGHHTLQSCKVSQFEQHLRAIMGLDMNGSELKKGAVMSNILGTDRFTGKYESVVINEKDVFLKMYNKVESKPLRKLGHFTVTGDKTNIEELIKYADVIHSKINLKQVKD
ncbi:MAG: 5-(carboxyamino)imidazole ribonucleotide synthase [Candidatus Nitrosoabyssus spongiisocia]|nr:MAG: 5-(carboxyamino)imidazole ribonucleotide synthase [Nitrosopumilaceae archaeon AB1(1)]